MRPVPLLPAHQQGAPLTAILVFPCRLGPAGLWSGMTIGIWAAALVLFTLAVRSDYDLATRRALKTVGATDEEKMPMLAPSA